ncbi:MAG TPA: signal peptidase I [Actinomycetota bacterium]|jgi:signal peptidase
MRTRQQGRHRLGRIAHTRPRDALLRDPLDVELPDPASEPVTGEPLAERAMRELDPEVLRGDADAPAVESSPEETAAEETDPHSGAYRAGRRALMLACWSVLGFAVVIVLAVTLPSAFGLRDLTVLSGSMEPTISTGDVVVERQISPLDVQLGDVVSFKDPEDASILITHRVQSMVVHDGVVSFVTKGDANTGVERWKVSADGTLGKVEYHVWRLGYLLFWMRGPLGRIVLVVVPALVLGAYELIRIWRPRPRAATEEGDSSEQPDDPEESEADEAPA